ncbi:AAA family ATPase [uncultured Lamprocystis sp.]|jgi:hypothetical protein|uniref:McrB family protein n=1 Tax=uncultured Lamprocystis sp. TaxID=543132 RepID=UPI0025F8F976|nr:AAA family ATPase [uncultured Lamprocystis sp.]
MNERKPGHKSGAATGTLPPEQRRQDLQKRITDLENHEKELKASVAVIATDAAAKRKELKEIEADAQAKRREHENALAQIKADIEAERASASLIREQETERHRLELATMRTSHDNALQQAETQFEAERALASLIRKQETERLRHELAEIRTSHDESLRGLANQSKQLTDSVRNQADRLFELHFITKEQRATLLGLHQSDAATQTSDWPTLTDLHGGYPQLASHLQRYLYRKQIIYPRAVLATFHALMLTSDFVILSGLSGSGKTMLVKSYAQATGNVAHIIPVKPNWTSAEDLIGYYNPLQCSYLTTPFLDALLTAQQDPQRLHIICLDEMNLARIEYYFADFLSALEERDEPPTIALYADEEAGHVHAEFKLLVDSLMDAGADTERQGLDAVPKNREILATLKDRLGFDDGESVLNTHARLRRMVAGLLKVPSRLPIPTNVRFVGTVNMDATTHYLSPKVLDRAHVIQFQSPLSYWQRVIKEIGDGPLPETGVCIPATEFPREPYPPFAPHTTDAVSQALMQWADRYLEPMGIEIGLRLIRQAAAFRQHLGPLLEAGNSNEACDALVLNQLIKQKLLPRFSFDGKQPSRRGDLTVAALVSRFQEDVAERLKAAPAGDAKDELRGLIKRAEANDGIFNYWS